jgi:class 3 adenylate cyclase
MTKEVLEAVTIPAKYVFLDVVGFTRQRSVEAQSDIVHVLNDIVQASITENEVPKDKLILLPTGDGMCIALLNIESPYDIHLLVALSIVKRVHEHNEETKNGMRKFEVRIGINSNIDNLVTDVNGNRNIAGAGISVASRVMDIADGNQILVGESVFDTLRYREKYMSAFKNYPATVKHEVKLPIYQLIQEGYVGLNIDTPKILQVPEQAEPKLKKSVAYYFAHAAKNRQVFLKNKDKDETSTVLLYFLAKDSVQKSETADVDTPYLSAYKANVGASIEEQLEYYNSLYTPILIEFAQIIVSQHLSTYRRYFEGGYFQYQFINADGVEKLRREWPDIHAEFFDQSTA